MTTDELAGFLKDMAGGEVEPMDGMDAVMKEVAGEKEAVGFGQICLAFRMLSSFAEPLLCFQHLLFVHLSWEYIFGIRLKFLSLRRQ